MVGLVDIAPVTSTILVRGQDITITGVSARGIALLLLGPGRGQLKLLMAPRQLLGTQ